MHETKILLCFFLMLALLAYVTGLVLGTAPAIAAMVLYTLYAAPIVCRDDWQALVPPPQRLRW